VPILCRQVCSRWNGRFPERALLRTGFAETGTEPAQTVATCSASLPGRGLNRPLSQFSSNSAVPVRESVETSCWQRPLSQVSHAVVVPSPAGIEPMSDEPRDRRREPRSLIRVQAVLRMQGNSVTCPAVTRNISTGGLLLTLTESSPFKVGDHVECEIALPDDPGHAFASWGLGGVVRVDEWNAAVELQSAVFASADET